MIKTEDIIHRREAVKEETSLRKAAYKIMSTRYPGLPVVNDALEVIGVVTEHDLIKAFRQGADPDSSLVKDVMNREPVTADVNTPVDRVIDLMIENRFTMIPITKNNRLAGIACRDSVLEVYVESGIWDYYSQR
ncbi:MAG: CBS domain-containing protein [Nitrospirae bacterium]|nr:MAG: CBS domain-containing protein [Nitrospirota bacterium]